MTDSGRCNTPDGFIHPCSDMSCEHYLPNNMGLAFGHGKTLLPFQEEGVRFIDAHGINAMNADQMGTGKTPQTLAVLALHRGLRPAIIVCPASLKLNWEREAGTWLETDDVIEVVKTGKAKPLTGDIIILNYDILKKWVPELQSIHPQIIIFDESHALKNKAAARSKAAKELAATIPHKILLTGTPVLNRPSELWHQLQIIDPITYSDKHFFKWHLRYADAHKIWAGRKTVWDFTGASNLDELAQSLNSIMIRRTKAQVLAELPDKRRQTIPLKIDNRKEYDMAENDFLAWVKAQRGAAAADRVTHVEELAKIEALRQIAIKGKMKQSVAWISDFLESGEKLVVFATHRATIDTLMQEFPKIMVRLDGGMGANERQLSVDRFQNDPEIRLFAGNIQAAGVGITLTAASDVVFLELGWTPALMEQAEDRCHRFGQKNAVNCVYLLAEKTVDVNISAMLEQKRGIVDQITDDKPTLGFELFEMIRGE